MKIITGLILVAAAIGLALLFKLFVVNPLTQPIEGARHGELYGPMMFLRYVVYGLCIAQAEVGLLIILVFNR